MPRILVLITIIVFVAIGLSAWAKSIKKPKEPNHASATFSPIEISLESEVRVIEPPPLAQSEEKSTPNLTEPIRSSKVSEPLPSANRIEEFFNLEEPKLPIVETVTYKSRVEWHKGSPAWISDYASHYGTSRHFIARSLNQKADYWKQDVADGNRFNVFKPGKKIHFYLVIDTSLCKMWFYYHDLETQDRVLVKSYDVGLGRLDESKKSGLLTPLGQYSLGDRIATYKPAVMGNYKGQQVEMIRVFGTRWIPFEKEISDTTAPAKGYGIHGVPYITNSKTGQLIEDTQSLGKYESDGCIRMATKDVEELYAIIITKPTTVVLVKNFYDAELPGKESSESNL